MSERKENPAEREPSAAWLRAKAAAEDKCESVAAGVPAIGPLAGDRMLSLKHGTAGGPTQMLAEKKLRQQAAENRRLRQLVSVLADSVPKGELAAVMEAADALAEKGLDARDDAPAAIAADLARAIDATYTPRRVVPVEVIEAQTKNTTICCGHGDYRSVWGEIAPTIQSHARTVYLPEETCEEKH